MPFIDTKLAIKLSETQKIDLKTALGKAISVMNKPETYLMVGIVDGYDLFLGGQKLDKGAFVSVQVLGEVNAKQSDDMTAEISKALAKFDIPSENVYVNYQGFRDWGHNGHNF